SSQSLGFISSAAKNPAEDKKPAQGAESAVDSSLRLEWQEGETEVTAVDSPQKTFWGAKVAFSRGPHISDEAGLASRQTAASRVCHLHRFRGVPYQLLNPRSSHVQSRSCQ